MNGITLEELKVIIDAQTKPFRDELKKIKEETSKTTNSVMQSTNKIKNMFGGVKKFLVGLGITTAMYKIAKSSLSMATQVEAATQQLNFLMGESAQAFMRWGKENALALNMSQKDFAQYSSVYANLLSSFIHSTSGVANQTAKLLQASAVIQSATGRTMEDVMERIRSGLLGNTEAIEDLGINVNVALLESTEAFRKFAGDKSWQQLDFQTQQQIRLMAILEQTSNKFGDSVHQNTNTSLAMCAAIIKDIVLNIGNTLLPLLNMVLPVVINIGMAVRNATQYMADFMTTLFGNGSKTTASATKSQNKYVDSLNATTDAANKAKKALGGLMGLDELTVITSPNSSSNESNSSSNANYNFGGDLFAEEPKTNGVQNAVDKVRKKIDEFKKYMKTNAPVITSLITGIITGLASFNIVKSWPAIVKFISPVSEAFQFLWLQISTFLVEIAKGSGIFKALSAAFSPAIASAALIAGAIAAVTSALVYLFQTSEEFRSLVVSAIDSIKGVLTNFWESLVKPFFNFINEMYNSVILPVVSFIGSTFVGAIDLLGSVFLHLWNEILAPLANFVITKFGESFAKWSNSTLTAVSNVKTIFSGLSSFINTVFDTIKGVLNGIITFISGTFSGNWQKAWQGIKDVFSSLVSGFANIFKKPINAIIDGINSFISGINKIKIPDWVPGVGGKGFSISAIPKLAYGGIVNRSILANIGEAGSEAVIPLERNTGGIQKIAQKISSFMDSSDYNSDIPEILMAIIDILEGIEFSPVVEAEGEIIARVVNKANKRMARRQGYSY